MESLAGKLLVASRRLGDPNFTRSVVLLIHHDSRGALGLVLNRAGAERLEVTHDGDDGRRGEVVVMTGGPLEGPLTALHTDPENSEREVIPGVHFAAGSPHLDTLLAAARRPLRVFRGYSGWGGGQLEKELAAGAWTVADASADLVFGDDPDLWRRASRLAFDALLARALGVRHVPPQPWHN